MFRQVKMLFYRFFLRRAVRKKEAHEQAMLNIQQAHSVGILFQINSPEDLQTILTFSKKLKEQGKKVILLGHKPSALTIPTLDDILLNKKDINWYYKPIGVKVDRFIERDLDILIGAFIEEVPSLEYIVATSTATFRVGAYHADKAYCYDMMVQTNQQDTLESLVHRIAHFLNEINKHDASAKRDGRSVSNAIS